MTSRLRATFAAICVATMVSTPAWSRHVTLNDTGMNQCVDHHGDWLSQCAKSRQDAAYGRDAYNADPDDGAVGFSFRKVCRSGQMAGEGSCPADPVLGSGPDDWGCVYDNVTELTWEAKTDDDGLHDGKRAYTNKGKKARDEPSDSAWLVDATNAEALCGATNWRLPNALDLASIVHYGYGAPNMFGAWIDPTYFPNDRFAHHWTRTEYVSDSKWAWYVDFGSGAIGQQQRFDDAGARLVHGASGVPVSVPIWHSLLNKDRFVFSPDGAEVTDTMTGLVWRRCAQGMVWNNNAQTCDGTAAKFSWKEALQEARVNHHGGWRIPNIKELFSIVDLLEPQSPAIDHLAFPNTPADTPFLSSTPMSSTEGVRVQLVWFFRGQVFADKTNKFNGWPLRFVRRGRE